MGLLDQVLGGLMGGSGGNSPMQSVLMGLLSGNNNQGNATQPGNPAASNMAAGLGGLVSSFQQAGLGNIVQSWISNGANHPVSPDQLQSVLGQGQVQNMASQAGMPAGDFLSPVEPASAPRRQRHDAERATAGRGQRIRLSNAAGVSMVHRIKANRGVAAVMAAALLAAQMAPAPARADNAMGYRLLSDQEAATLPRSRGSLGLDIERASQINDHGMTFDIMRVKAVRRDSPGAQAGFRPGDQIIAVDGRVFPTIKSFAAYIGSVPPGNRIAVDYMPAGTGPQQAQRVTAVIAQAGQPTPPAPASQSAQGGLSTGEKIAIGVGAAALLVCYKRGCFSRQTAAQSPAPVDPAMQQPAPAR